MVEDVGVVFGFLVEAVDPDDGVMVLGFREDDDVILALHGDNYE